MADEMKTTLEVKTVADTKAIDQVDARLAKLEERRRRIALAEQKHALNEKRSAEEIRLAQQRLAQAEEKIFQRKKQLDEAQKGRDKDRALREKKINSDELIAIERIGVKRKQVDTQESYRQDINRREADRERKRREEALTRHQRQVNALNASQDRANSIANKAAVLVGFRGDIEKRAGLEAIKNLRSRIDGEGKLYKSKLDAYTDTDAQSQRMRLLAKDDYQRAISNARSEFQIKSALGKAEQSQFNRDMRERERSYRDLQRQRAQGFSDLRSGGSKFLQEARKPAMVAAAAAAAGGVAAAQGIRSRMDVDTAETNLRIFGDDNGKNFTKQTVAALRSGWLDALSIETGNDPASGLRAFTELNKQGIKDAEGNTKLLLRATTGLELDRGETTKLLGLLDRNLGTKSSPARMSSALDAIAVAAKDDPSQASEIVEGMKRGFGAMSRGNMTPEQLTSLVSGGQSVGIQPGKAGTFVDALTQELAEGGFARGQRKKDLNKAASMFGFGSGRNMAHASATDTYGTIIKILEKLDQMSPEKRAKATALLSQRQWSGEDLQMVQGLSGMKKTYADIQKDIAKPEKDRFLERAYQEKAHSLEMEWRRTKAIVSRFWEAFGVGFEDIYREVNKFFFERTKSFNWLSISDAVKGFLKGFINGLGFDNITALLEYVFGKPGDAKSYISTLTEFGRGFGEGLRSIFGPIKALLAVFGATSPAIIGKITGELVALSIALIALSPLVSAIGAIVGLITAVTGAVKILQAAGLLKGANPGGPGGVKPPMGPSSSAPFFSRMFSGIGRFLPAFMMPLTMDPSKDANDRMTRRLGDYAKEHMGDLPAAAPITRGGTPNFVDEYGRQIVPNTKAIEENTKALIEKQSYNGSGSFGSLVQKASYSSGSSSDIQSLGARVQLAALGGGGSAFGRIGGGGGGGSASAAGITYTPGAGGASLYSSRPGSKIGGFGSGQRFGGGGGRSSSSPADDGPSDPIAGALNPRLAGSRKSLMDELDRDPALKRDVIKTASMENRGSSFKMQTVLESMVNRAKMNGYTSLRQAIHSGFYGPVNRGGLSGALSEKDRSDGEKALQQVRNGSNAIGYRTDQGMLTDPGARRYMREADHSGHKVIGGENFFLMGQKGREWARRQEALDAAAGTQGAAAASYVLGGKPGTYGSFSTTSSGFTSQSGSELAKTTPAESLAKKAPPAMGGGGGGGGGTQVHAPITIHNNGDSEHVANQVQRRIADAKNYVTHDVSWDSA